MKFLVSILLVALFAFALGLYLPWWSIGIAAFVVIAFINQSSGKAFLTGFLGIFLLWLIISIAINTSNNGLLASKVAAILPLGGSAFLLILFTAFIGGLVGGMAALTASFLVKK
jgi:hypothetical protein